MGQVGYGMGFGGERRTVGETWGDVPKAEPTASDKTPW